MRRVQVLILAFLAAIFAWTIPTMGVATAAQALTSAQLQQTTDKYLFKVSLTEFLKARSNKPHNGQLNWTTDTCSWSPDRPHGFDFRGSCWRHDFGYRNYKKQGRFTEAARKQIDDNFRKDMYSVCDRYKGWESFRGVQCRRIADTYHGFVRVRGR